MPAVYLRPMRRALLNLWPLAALALGCTKEEPVLRATFHATCRDCVVRYATGTAQSRADTLLGVPVAGTSDTLEETASWAMELKEGDNVYIRACRLRPDTVLGALSVRVDGDVRPLEAQTDTADCVEINAVSAPR
jgi:hypothetical protein